MPIYDVLCETCNIMTEEWLSMDIVPENCPICGDKRFRLPGGHFKLKYDPKKDSCSWAYDGYNSSQYWRAVREARDRGEKVKACNED